MMSGLRNIVKMRCPRCRKGLLFRNPNLFQLKDLNKMYPECQVCKQDFVIEPGFYFGATYLSYGLNFAWIIPLFVICVFVFDLSLNVFGVIMFAILLVLIPLIYRLSRSAYLAIFVRYNADYAQENPKTKLD